MKVTTEKKNKVFTQHIESAGGGGGAYLVLCLTGVLSNVSLGGFAELQTGHALRVLESAGGTGANFTVSLEPRHLDLRRAGHLALQTNGVSCRHLHGLQGLHKVWRFCIQERFQVTF